MYKGQFGGTDAVEGNWAMDGFNVYDYSNVVFGAYTSATTPYTAKADYQQTIQVKAQNASIATNPITNGILSKVSSNVYIYYGTYNIGNAGIWNDNATLRIYNTANAIGYTLTKGGGTVENNPAVTLFNGQL